MGSLTHDLWAKGHPGVMSLNPLHHRIVKRTLISRRKQMLPKVKKCKAYVPQNKTLQKKRLMNMYTWTSNGR